MMNFFFHFSKSKPSGIERSTFGPELIHSPTLKATYQKLENDFFYYGVSTAFLRVIIDRLDR